MTTVCPDFQKLKPGSYDHYVVPLHPTNKDKQFIQIS